MTESREWEQIDARLRNVSESIVAMETSLKILEGMVEMMNTALFRGNGKPSLSTRLEMLEFKITEHSALVSEYKAYIMTSAKHRDEAIKALGVTRDAPKESGALIVIERWKAVVAIVTAICASPVILAIIEKLFKP